ncbi:MAG: ATP-binding cassette domain-containing protein [Deltaproteobacteria bacterium]|nr:ATP-binding cassette domain-containing protein [Deltaproteobacteria bacterium]
MIEAVRLGVVGRGGILWDGLDFTIGEGEVRLVTGPPSSGKSVLLKVLSAGLRPHAGEVLVGGRSLYRNGRAVAAAFRAETSVVAERFPAAEGRTVSDLFRLSALSASRLSAAEWKRREEELLALVGLPSAGPWGLATLSTSERARVALAVELLHGPRYLFADGLLGNAGGEWEDILAGLFRALAREGKTVVAMERVPPPRLAPAALTGVDVGPFRFYRCETGGAVPR